jgi:hypothetical protein
MWAVKVLVDCLSNINTKLLMLLRTILSAALDCIYWLIFCAKRCKYGKVKLSLCLTN